LAPHPLDSVGQKQQSRNKVDERLLTGDVGGPVEGLGHVGIHLDEVVLLGFLVPLVAPGLHPAGEGLPDLRVEDVDEVLQKREVIHMFHNGNRFKFSALLPSQNLFKLRR
jgi:hypothetical protein